MTDKISALLGFAAKAGRLSFGMDATTDSIKRGTAKLVVVSGEVSKKSRKEIFFHSEKNNVRVLTLDDCNINALSSAVGRKCGIISVNDASFADGIIKASIQGGNV